MKKRTNFTIMRKLIVLVKPLAIFMFSAILMGLIGHLCASFITILGGFAVLNILKFPNILNLSTIFILLCIFALIRGVLRYLEQSCNHFIAFKLLALIRDKVFISLRKLCPAKLEGKDSGNLISIITSDIELLEVFYAHTISPIAIAFLFSIILCIFIGNYHWILGIIALCAYITAGIIIPLMISKSSGSLGISFRTKSGDLSSFVLDSLRGLSETLQFNMGQKRLDEMLKKTDTLADDEKELKKISGRNTAITNSIILIFDIIMLFVSSILYKNGIINFDGILIPTLALMSSFGPVNALAALGSTLQNTFAAGNRVLDILEEKPVIDEITNQKEIVFNGAKAQNVSFSYGSEEILSNISLNIKPNTITGITGKSGSGKSTLLKLFMRFWDTEKGNIQISNTEISKINTVNLRNMESLVTQQTHLFHDSIANNLRIAKLDASQQELETACKKASVHDFIISLPKGYDTPVGELGDTLSGGEKQRLGLARAFLHNSDFILLDEPTSNLDSLNEAIILKSLSEECKNKSVVLVSHRESTMKIADNVYSVENGRIS